MKSIPSRIAGRYIRARDALRDFEDAVRCIFSRCEFAGWTIVVVCTAGGFWIGLALKTGC